ncbi:MAG TPA: hypothetical protein VEG44_02750 [Candidatus Acidoferrales bacterium]|nr:hypothetical protein [Candidatus Acidoferrales bacterium]
MPKKHAIVSNNNINTWLYGRGQRCHLDAQQFAYTYSHASTYEGYNRLDLMCPELHG